MRPDSSGSTVSMTFCTCSPARPTVLVPRLQVTVRRLSRLANAANAIVLNSTGPGLSNRVKIYGRTYLEICVRFGCMLVPPPKPAPPTVETPWPCTSTQDPFWTLCCRATPNFLISLDPAGLVLSNDTKKCGRTRLEVRYQWTFALAAPHRPLF